MKNTDKITVTLSRRDWVQIALILDFVAVACGDIPFVATNRRVRQLATRISRKAKV